MNRRNEGGWEYPDEMYVTMNSEGELFGQRDLSDLNEDEPHVARYKLVETGAVRVERAFEADDREP